MPSKVNHDLRSVNAGTIFLVPQPNFINLAIPDLSLPDTVQKYDIGTKYEFNGKVYFYSYTTGAVHSRRSALTSYFQALAERDIGADADIYATSIVLTVASPDGPSVNGTLPKDYLKGGSVLVWINQAGGDDDDDFHRGIIGHPALAAAGVVTVELDAPIPHAITNAASVACAIASPYASIHTSAGNIGRSSCGVPTCYAAAERWVWIQTWGQCAISAQSGPGVEGEHAVFFRADGALDTHSQAVSAAISNQHAGYVLYTSPDSSQGAPFIYLQIAK